MDMTRFVNNVTKIDETKVPTILYQWTRKVHCICHMPDDGSKMVQCSKFMTWYHQKCVRGDFSKREWLCPKCEFTEMDQPLAWEDQPWIAQLNLTVKERNILQERNWLNDAIINAAMILLRRQRRDNRIGGLEDVVVARKSGFPYSDSGQGFVQIINIRQNHWLTLSNVLCASSRTCVYDSLHTKKCYMKCGVLKSNGDMILALAGQFEQLSHDNFRFMRQLLKLSSKCEDQVFIH